MGEHGRREPFPTQEGKIGVTGGDVWYKIVNPNAPKTPLLTLHGGPGFPSTDLASLDPLAADRPVIFYDQLGCGKSDKPDDTSLWTLDRFAEEVQLVREAIGLDAHHILGLSWGGTLAVEDYLVNRPRGLKSMVLSSPMISESRVTADIHRQVEAMFGQGTIAYLTQLEAEGKAEESEYRKIVDAFEQKHVYGEAMDLENLPQALQDSNEGIGWPVFHSMVGYSEINPGGRLLGHERVDRLKEIAIPVLYTAGYEDEITPESVIEFQTATPNSELVIFSRSAHLAHWTEQPQYLKTVGRFLRKVDNAK
jgi:proline iminopeptidase